jgi:hypothetical protein
MLFFYTLFDGLQLLKNAYGLKGNEREWKTQTCLLLCRQEFTKKLRIKYVGEKHTNQRTKEKQDKNTNHAEIRKNSKKELIETWKCRQGEGDKESMHVVELHNDLFSERKCTGQGKATTRSLKTSISRKKEGRGNLSLYWGQCTCTKN